jgi:hypothetical protein
MAVRHRFEQSTGAICRSLHTFDLNIHNCEYT